MDRVLAFDSLGAKSTECIAATLLTDSCQCIVRPLSRTQRLHLDGSAHLMVPPATDYLCAMSKYIVAVKKHVIGILLLIHLSSGYKQVIAPFTFVERVTADELTGLQNS